jgi:hypothetical protein
MALPVLNLTVDYEEERTKIGDVCAQLRSTDGELTREISSFKSTKQRRDRDRTRMWTRTRTR